MINSVVLVGRAGKAPEKSYFQNDKVKTVINMGVKRPVKDGETDWFRVEFWGKDAETAAQYVKKGHVFGVEGRIETWEKDGKRGTTIIGNKLRLLPNADTSGGDSSDDDDDSWGNNWG